MQNSKQGSRPELKRDNSQSRKILRNLRAIQSKVFSKLKIIKSTLKLLKMTMIIFHLMIRWINSLGGLKD